MYSGADATRLLRTDTLRLREPLDIRVTWWRPGLERPFVVDLTTHKERRELLAFWREFPPETADVEITLF